MIPGATPITLTPFLPSSFAQDLVNEFTAFLLAAYIPCPSEPSIPHSEDIFIITPCPCFTISLPAICAHKYTPFTFMSITLSYILSFSSYLLFSSLSSISKEGIFIPALFTNTSILPKVSLAFCTAELILSLSVTFIFAYNILPLFSSI
ncbi:hypothetical protein SDC9_191165 [bioreactor metagenome]|uniref:Uncharacterized protein n=1 Tax=bioreactor metagenome TaxID=1076179 RepID=A0A645HX41_9ZZZZ